MIRHLAQLLRRRKPAYWVAWPMVLLTIYSGGAGQVYAIEQNDLYTMGINYFNLNACNTTPTSTGSANGDTTYISGTPPGADPEEQVWNFFVAKTGLSPAATAGIMGNIQAESHFDPTEGQTKGAWEDMSTRNINEGGGGGVGLVQWDGGRRPAYINYAKEHGADPKDIVPQLNYIWDELNHSYKTSTLDRITADTTPTSAAFDFHKYYEGSADSPERVQGRMNNATAIMQKYASLADSESLNAACAASNSLSPECASAVGRARIICQAEKYDTVSYYEGYEGGHQGAAAWHASCPVIGPSCYLDCSGLVNIAIYDVYGVELNENTDSERADVGKYWQEIKPSDLQPGDIVQPMQTHVEIIDHVQGNTLFTFGAHTDNRPQPEQVGPSNGFPISPQQRFFRYIGPGSHNGNFE